MNLTTKIEEIAGVGLAYVKRLNKIGILNVRDLLYHFPRRYDDFSRFVDIGKVRGGEVVTIKGSVWQIASKRSKRGLSILEAVIADETGTIKTIWFNQPFLKNTLKVGTEVVLAGKAEWNFGALQMQSPAFEVIRNENREKREEEGRALGSNSKQPKANSNLTHTGGIIPIYPETEGLSSKWLRDKIKPIINLASEVKEYLPLEFLKKHGLMVISETIKELHFPTDTQSLEKAKRRIDFEEMFFLQVGVARTRMTLKKNKSVKIGFDEAYAREFVEKVGFKLTNAQRKAAFEILKDMDSTVPMNRLLEGDVGSGKTLVAAMAMAMVAHGGKQAVIVAPTEILARQHFDGLRKLLTEFNALLLTSNSVETSGNKQLTINNKQKNQALGLMANGEVDIIISTHAIFQEKVEFRDLGLVIIDEQHRFGVEQRSALKKENKSGLIPHFLSMSATPMPRTLTLTIYGDLDVSILDELPPGRKPVTTRLAENIKKYEAYKFIDSKIEEGRQVFVVCPLIEASDKLGVHSVTEEYEKLKDDIFPHRRIGMLHGKMKSKEKEETMNKFIVHELDVLVATSVIEVGVNVPNASIMMIEGADRFGLAQLHQFRGRVGRGEHQSYCILFTDSSGDATLKRLKSFVNISDGFKLAEADLEIRGPGEVFGLKQSGLPDIKTKNLMNIKLIMETKKAAADFLEEYDLGELPALKAKVGKYDIVKTLE